MVRIEIAATINIHPISQASRTSTLLTTKLGNANGTLSMDLQKLWELGLRLEAKEMLTTEKCIRITGPRSQSSVQTARMRRSNGGKFVCQCKREYESVQALLKHKKRCFVEEMMDVDEDGAVSKVNIPLFAKIG